MGMTEQTKNPRAAVIVTRVSTGEQVKHGTSLESQLELCRAKAKTLGLTISAEYEDAGVSGGLRQTRAGMQAAIADITAGRASHLVCATLDRFSRTVEHQWAIKREIEAAGGAIVFCDMDFDDTPEGDLNFAIQGGFKQYERQAIRARTMRGKRKRAESGQQPQRSRPPFGYLIVTHADVTRGTYPPEMLGRYVIVEDKAAIVCRLFEGYTAGTHSMPSLARALNQEGVPTPGGGRAWLEPTLRFLLTNPVYKGQPASGRQKTVVDEGRLQQVHKLNGRPITRPEMRVARPQNEWVALSAPPLVTADIWQAAQERMVQMRTFQGGNPRRTYMLSGKVFCPHCGAQAVIKHQKANGVTYRYYLCGDQRRSRVLGPERPCVGDLYPIHEMEQAALAALEKVLTCPESVTEALAVHGPAGRHPGGCIAGCLRSGVCRHRCPAQGPGGEAAGALWPPACLQGRQKGRRRCHGRDVEGGARRAFGSRYTWIREAQRAVANCGAGDLPKRGCGRRLRPRPLRRVLGRRQ